MTKPLPRKVLVALIAITALGLVLRLVSSGAIAPTGDEVLNLLPGTLWEAIMQDLSFNPPGFRLLVWFVTLPSSSLLLGRLVSVIAGVLAIPVLFFVSRRLLTTSQSLLASAFLALHPWAIFHSQSLRAYSVFLLTTLGVLWLAARVLEKENSNRRLAFSLGMAFLASVHYLAFLVLAPVWIVSLRRRGVRRTLLDSAPTIALYAVLLVVVMKAIGGKAESRQLTPDYQGFQVLWDFFHTAMATGGLAGLAGSLLLLAGLDHPKTPRFALVGLIYLAVVAILGYWVPVELRYTFPIILVPAILLPAGYGRSLQSLAAQRHRWMRCLLTGMSVLYGAGLCYSSVLLLTSSSPPHQVELQRDLEGVGQMQALLEEPEDKGAPVAVLTRGRGYLALFASLNDNTLPDGTTVTSTAQMDTISSSQWTLLHPLVEEGADSDTKTADTLLETLSNWAPEGPFRAIVPLDCDPPNGCSVLATKARFALLSCHLQEGTR